MLIRLRQWLLLLGLCLCAPSGASGSALLNLTAVQGRLRDLDGAAESSGQALTLARSLNDPMMIARALFNRGQVYGQRGEHEAVRVMLAEARALAATLPPGDLAINLDLGEASNASDRGRTAESRVALDRVLATARELGNRYYRAFAACAWNWLGPQHRPPTDRVFGR